MQISIYADGACWGNPGPAAIGAVLKGPDNRILAEISESIGIGTNNQAEYKAVITALNVCKDMHVDEVVLYIDSELVIRQFAGRYKVKNPALKPLYTELIQLSKKYRRFEIMQIGHDDNSEAHHLAQAALEKAKRDDD
jgi:ribonuclease HI